MYMGVFSFVPAVANTRRRIPPRNAWYPDLVPDLVPDVALDLITDVGRCNPIPGQRPHPCEI